MPGVTLRGAYSGPPRGDPVDVANGAPTRASGLSKTIAGRITEVRMLDIKRILCPIDFSDASRHAMDHAVAFAEWSGSQ